MKNMVDGSFGFLLLIIWFLPSIIGIILGFSAGIIIGIISLLFPPFAILTGFLYIFTDINLAETIGGLF